MIACDPDAFYFRGDRSRFDADALEDYLRCVRNPDTIHAMCEDYRAGATFDRELDETDRASGRRISCPVLVLWSARDELHRWYDGDVISAWREWATDVRGRPIDAGHFIAEEAPEATYEALVEFFAELKVN